LASVSNGRSCGIIRDVYRAKADTSGWVLLVDAKLQ
jgi:hypothetical protein